MLAYSCFSFLRYRKRRFRCRLISRIRSFSVSDLVSYARFRYPCSVGVVASTPLCRYPCSVGVVASTPLCRYPGSVGVVASTPLCRYPGSVGTVASTPWLQSSSLTGTTDDVRAPQRALVLPLQLTSAAGTCGSVAWNDVNGEPSSAAAGRAGHNAATDERCHAEVRFCRTGHKRAYNNWCNGHRW